MEQYIYQQEQLNKDLIYFNNVQLYDSRQSYQLFYLKMNQDKYELNLYSPLQNQDQEVKNLYELPNCTICLQQMVSDLNCLACGHVFHSHCIRQQFQYRGSCPNCQARSHMKELRSLILQYQLNDSSENRIKKLILNLQNQSGKNQTQNLISKLKIEALQKLRLSKQKKQLEDKLKNLETQNKDFKESLSKSENLIKDLKRQSEILKRQKNNTRQKLKTIEQQNKIFELQIQSLEEKVKKFQIQETQYMLLKKVQETINSENSDFLLKKHDYIENDKLQGIEYFYTLAMSTRLDVKELKRKLSLQPHLLKQKDDIIHHIKYQLDNIKKKYETSKSEEANLREKVKKYRVKFIQMKEKLKQTNPQAKITIDLQDSIGFQSIQKKLFNNTSESNQQSKKQTKPLLGSFGGFGFQKKKVDDKNRINIMFN